MTIIFARQQWAVHCVIVCWDGRDNAATVTIVHCPPPPPPHTTQLLQYRSCFYQHCQRVNKRSLVISLNGFTWYWIHSTEVVTTLFSPGWGCPSIQRVRGVRSATPALGSQSHKAIYLYWSQSQPAQHSPASPAQPAQHSRSWADKLALAFLILYLTIAFRENIVSYASSPIISYSSSRHYECRAHSLNVLGRTRDGRAAVNWATIGSLLSCAARSRVCLTIVTTLPRPGRDVTTLGV